MNDKVAEDFQAHLVRLGQYDPKWRSFHSLPSCNAYNVHRLVQL